MTCAVNPAAFAVAWGSDLSVPEIGRAFGLSTRTAYRLAARLSLPSRDPVQRALEEGVAPGAITLPQLRFLERPSVPSA